MTARGAPRIVVGFILATMACSIGEDADPCSGCTSPHSHLVPTGGGFDGFAYVDVPYVTAVTTLSEVRDATARGFDLTARVPRDWKVEDAGAPNDGGSSDGSADASGADASDEPDGSAPRDAGEAEGGIAGEPLGWGGPARVARVDLDAAGGDGSERAVVATVTYCEHPYASLSEDAAECITGARTPALREILRGNVDRRVDVGKVTITIDATSPSGVRVRARLEIDTTPPRTVNQTECY